MTMPLRRLFLALASLSLVVVSAKAELPIIAKARAWYGSEDALNSVQSIHYVGVVTQPGAQESGVPIEMIFAKPYRQRIVAKASKATETTVLDGYSAWQRIQDPKDATKWRIDLLPKDGLKRLRANNWENTAYFRGLERDGGRVVDEGDATADGVACRKVAFVHDPDIIFYRYFDKQTGRLVLTETEAHGTIRTEGEIVVNGIRFPQKLIMVTPSSKGGMQQATITFSSIRVNDALSDSLYAMPSMAK